jgi:L,D-transpeptidase catalytic domain
MRLRIGAVAVLAAAFVFTVDPPARASVLITINKATQQMSVTVDGIKQYTWPVSTGRSGYGTPSGTFTPFRLEEDHYSKEWDDAPMPHSIFFTPKGHAIHGSYETKRLGSAASHGCVRLAPQNAAKLFALVKAEGLGNTKVVLTGAPPPMIARRPAQPQQPQGEPVDLEQYRSPYAAQPQYQNPYAAQPQYQQRYAVQPQYQQPYAPQPQYQQPYAVQPRYAPPAYGAQPYPPRYYGYQ